MKEYDPEKWTALVGDIYQIRRALEKEAPSCRERSLAITKLDEATFWLKEIPIVMTD